MPNYQLLKEKFNLHFGLSPEKIYIFHAPGRVNLIGEHTDYNGGYVFPAALTFGTSLLIRMRADKKIGLKTTNFELAGEIELDKLSFDKKDNWMNYPKGIFKQLSHRGINFEHGFDCYYHGEIPNGAGLSSSASIEVVTAYALLSLLQQPLNLTEIALLSQKTENEYIGVNSGIMDQFAVAQGKKDHAILLMCDTLEYRLVPFHSAGYKLVITNTNKRRELVDSKYNERRSECDLAVAQLRSAYPDLKLLGELSNAQLEEAKGYIQEEHIYRRAKHVVEENERVLASVEALEHNNLITFGQLMNESHQSLKELYEVTGHELDSLVDAAHRIDGVLGSRMTGAGFGGCTVSLVNEHSVDEFIAKVGHSYLAATGLMADFYVCELGQGVTEVTEEDI